MRATGIWESFPIALGLACATSYAITYAFTNYNPIVGAILGCSHFLTYEALEKISPKVSGITGLAIELFLPSVFTCLACNSLNLPITFTACLILQGKIALASLSIIALAFCVWFIALPLIAGVADITSRHFFKFELYGYLERKKIVWTYLLHIWPEANELQSSSNS